MIVVREATGRDVAEIRQIFLACYGIDYSDPRCYDEQQLTRLVYSPDTLILVAVDTDTASVVGTASVDLEVGAHADLVGEFGRLAVHPDYRQRGIAKLLMSERLEARPGSASGRPDRGSRGQSPTARASPRPTISPSSDSCPLRWLLRERESLALFVRYFGHCAGLAQEPSPSHTRSLPARSPGARELCHHSRLDRG